MLTSQTTIDDKRQNMSINWDSLTNWPGLQKEESTILSPSQTTQSVDILDFKNKFQVQDQALRNILELLSAYAKNRSLSPEDVVKVSRLVLFQEFQSI